MNTSKPYDQGVVIKKVYSQYHVYAGGRTILCNPFAGREKESLNPIAIGD
jgi:hypothetical protein